MGESKTDTGLPSSLAAKPNIEWEHQTIEQLEAERAYWQAQIDSAVGWGASIGAALSFMSGCDAWLSKRRAEAALKDPSHGQ